MPRLTRTSSIAPRGLALALTVAACSGLVAETEASHGSGVVTPAARVARASGDCGTNGVVCKQVSVPLDWSGKRAGRLSLHVEVLGATGAGHKAMFMLAGGPGQAAAQAFEIGTLKQLWTALFPGYTIVTFDPRGTGKSDPLQCPSLRASPQNPSAAAVAACAKKLGPDRAYYRTADNVDDIDAVRRALGFDRIALWGVSYGTEPAIGYARTFPSHTERLLLDSIVAPQDVDPFESTIMDSLPSKLKIFCAGGVCRAATPNYAGDVVALANRLARHVLRGRIRLADGKTAKQTLGAELFIVLVVQSDLDPGLAAELPAAVHGALHGDPTPLLRLARLVNLTTADGVDSAVFLATSCDDGPVPWKSSSSVGSRKALLEADLAALPKGAFGGFGMWASTLGNASLCLSWPPEPAGPKLTAPYPKLPVLALSGKFDIRTPAVPAQSVVTRFADGKFLPVANVGHSVLTSSLTFCVIGAVRGWLQGAPVPHSCSSPRLLEPLAAFPATGAAGSRAAVIQQTVREAEATWLLGTTEQGTNASGPVTEPGLGAGKLVGGDSSLTLSGYGLLPSLTVTGTLQASVQLEQPLGFTGTLHVMSGGRELGTVKVDGTSITVGGKGLAA